MRRRAAAGPRRPPWAGPLGLHHAGDSWVHRSAPGVKMAALGGLGVALLLVRGTVPTLGILVAVALVAAAARLPWRSTARGMLPVLLTAAVVGGYQWWARGPATGVEVAVDLVVLVLAATLVTATTSADRLLDALTRAARPLRHVGLRPDTFALAVGLMLRAVPALVQSAGEVRDAARARGLERSPRAVLVPAAVRTVARARATGDALAARGLGE